MMMRWDEGRRKSGYKKRLLLTGLFPLPFDMYLLKFPEGSKIDEHVDEVESGKHYRLNVILKQAKKGGIFKCGKSIFETSRIKLFRPDIEKHSVSEIVDGNRYVFSLGWIRDDK